MAHLTTGGNGLVANQLFIYRTNFSISRNYLSNLASFMTKKQMKIGDAVSTLFILAGAVAILMAIGGFWSAHNDRVAARETQDEVCHEYRHYKVRELPAECLYYFQKYE